MVEYQRNIRIVVGGSVAAHRVGVHKVVLLGRCGEFFRRNGEHIAAGAEAGAEESGGAVVFVVLQPAEEQVVSAQPLIIGSSAVDPLGIACIPPQGVVDVVLGVIVPVADLENAGGVHGVGRLGLDRRGKADSG